MTRLTVPCICAILAACIAIPMMCEYIQFGPSLIFKGCMLLFVVALLMIAKASGDFDQLEGPDLRANSTESYLKGNGQ